MKLHRLAACLAMLICQACSWYAAQEPIPIDPHSYSQPNKALASHLAWKGQVDFTLKRITARASWVIETEKDADTIVFDTYGLVITEVLLDNEQPTAWKLDRADAILGSALRIALKKGTQTVHIQYHTSSNAKGLQWLETDQTSNQQHPFLFSQGQAILTRSWLPCQDSPALRFSFDAELKVPPGLMAVMSAPNSANKSLSGTYHFSNPKPIPAYLFSLAVGDFEYKAFDDRSGIFAEKSMLAPAWQEFANLPPMIKAAERLFGDMPWSRFDVLVLPPSFPFGGMENPMIMFAAPTLIAGDRSLTNLVAHELAHAWSDQLLKHASWEDFWLNEFFTSYIERRIIEEMEGPSYAEMMHSLSNLELARNLAHSKMQKQALILVPDLEGKDPDLVLGALSYQKVTAMMMQLENSLGKKSIDQWIKKRLESRPARVYNTSSFVETYQKELFDSSPLDVATLNTWLNAPALPNNYAPRISARFANVEAVAGLWLQGEEITYLPTGTWSVYEWMYFLRVINQGQLPEARLAALDETLQFSSSGNAELQAVWFQLILQHNYLGALPAVEAYVAKTGRRKLLLVVYTALWNNLLCRDKAMLWFDKYQMRYHPVALNSIQQVLHP